MSQQLIRFYDLLKLNLKFAVWAAVFNCFWGLVVVKLFSIQGLPNGFMVAVVLSTFLVALLSTIGYFLLKKFFTRGLFLYYFLGTSFYIFCNFPAFELQLPDGSPMPNYFALLVLPMHAICAFLLVYKMPQLALKFTSLNADNAI